MGLIFLFMSVVFAVTEVGNMFLHFWYTNVFAGCWTSVILFHYTITVFINNCGSMRRLKKYAIFSSILLILSLAALIGFDILFIVRPETCLLTSNCTEQAVFLSPEFIFDISILAEYNQQELKQLIFFIQLGCAAFCLCACIIYLMKECCCTSIQVHDTGRASRSNNTISSLAAQTPIRPRSEKKTESVNLKTGKHIPIWSTSNPITIQISIAPPF
ncbi:unnamed protein product [Adineta ricciae]|uniref:Uncharacterized protein n=1 Tax=Adineta ricciae TaxID=249248 RepID=A0A815KZN6_ADIRI|nr:unnamed protein product [Adineta ricciae]